MYGYTGSNQVIATDLLSYSAIVKGKLINLIFWYFEGARVEYGVIRDWESFAASLSRVAYPFHTNKGFLHGLGGGVIYERSKRSVTLAYDHKFFQSLWRLRIRPEAADGGILLVGRYVPPMVVAIMFRLFPVLAVIYVAGTLVWMYAFGPGASLMDLVIVMIIIVVFPLWGRFLTNQKLPWFGARARNEIEQVLREAIKRT